MTQGQSIVKGDTLQKISGAGFIIAAILMVIGNLLMPYTTAPTSDLREMLKPLGEHEFQTQASSLFVTIGFLAMMIGITGVYRSITAGGMAWARLGFYVLLVGTALQIVSLSLDVATASAVGKWLAAQVESKEAAWGVVVVLNAIGRGVIPLTWIVYWLAFVFLGIGMIGSAVYPRWLGWTGLILAMPVISVSIIHTFTPRTTTITLTFVVFALLTNLWALVVRIWVARRAW
jgi:hypothetical protein